MTKEKQQTTKTDTTEKDVAGPLDQSAAAAALQQLLPRLQAIPSDQLTAPRVDVTAAAITALGVGQRLAQPALRERFARLPREEFAIANVDDLALVAQAAWYARLGATSEAAQQTEAKLPVATVQQALAIKTRMMAVGEYYFGDHPTVGPEIADIRIGTGYTDLANDLVRLAAIYRAQRAVVEQDTKHYLVSDEDDASRVAHLMVKELAQGQRERERHEIATRAWTLLQQVYGEVAAAGRWLFRNEAMAGIFVSLNAPTRRAPRAGKSDTPTPTPVPTP